MTLSEAEAYLARYFSSRGTYTLERMRDLLSELNHPELAIPVIHVGGTAGKGSTAYLIASILEQAGYRVGLYTSPHLVSITERIMINRKAIAQSAFVHLLESIKPMVPQSATYFEIITAMAFVYFARENVDIAVIEVGIGGKLDATNVVDPLVSVITNVGLDHTEILGNTIEKIARDKREIIKPKKPVISGVTQPNIIKLIEEKSKKTKSLLLLLNKDFHIEHVKIGTPITFDYVSRGHTIHNLALSLLGRHQVVNASLAITAVFQSRLKVSEVAIRNALSKASIPGRMEVTRGFVIDGAHNPMKMTALSQALSDHFAQTKFHTLFAVKGDKDCAKMIRLLAPHVTHWYPTSLERQTDWGKGVMLPLKALFSIVEKTDPGKPITPVPNISEFLGSVPPSPLLITGSLYLVGAALAWLSGSRI